jgi:ribonuclease HI
MKEGSREWYEQRLRSCLHVHDVAKVLKIRPMRNRHEDIIAWFYETSGIFTVKSAYRLAINEDRANRAGSSTSNHLDRPLYKVLCNVEVPPKVGIFAWKLALDGLATQDKRRRRGLVASDLCEVCGATSETSHHTVVTFTRARALCHEMRKIWCLPGEEQVCDTEPDWLIILLSTLNQEQRAQVLLVMWRAWFLRNNIIFGNGQESIVGSTSFLESYWITLNGIKQKRSPAEMERGKEPMGEFLREGRMQPSMDKSNEESVRWSPPRPGWVKVNTDAGFCGDRGIGSFGVMVRNQDGEVLLTAWNILPHCGSVEEAEVEACLQGMRMTLQGAPQPIIVESDCLMLIRTLQSQEENRSSWSGLIQEIKGVSMLLPECRFVHVKREANLVTHLLTRRALQLNEGGMRSHGCLECVSHQCNIEAARIRRVNVCNSTINLQ